VKRTRLSWLALLRVLGVCIGIGLLLLTVGRADWSLVRERLTQAGPGLLLAVVPFVLAAALDVSALRAVLGLVGAKAKAKLGALAVVHVAGEATAMSLPLGSIASEPLRAFLLQQHAGVDPAVGVAATAARKFLLIATEAMVVALGAWFGAATLAHLSQQLFSNDALPALAWLVVVILVLFVAGYAFLMREGAIALRAFSLLRRVLPHRLHARLEAGRAEFSRTDDLLARFFRLPGRCLFPVSATYVGVWLLEALETFIALRLLGVPLSWEAALCMESLLSFVRAIATFLPAGLGVQDLGYAMFLSSLGVADAASVGAAFAVFKRVKEALWVTLGYCSWSWASGQRAAEPIERTA
jgi:glycosyltransferase 2 family protein